MRFIIVIIFFFVLFSTLHPQDNPYIDWSVSFGGTESDESSSLIQTSDSGYMIVGGSHSFGTRNMELWIIKLDSQGNFQWENSFGDSGYDEGFDLIQVSDGYVICGRTDSYGMGSFDAWVLKIDNSGDEVWSQTYGGEGADFAHTIVQTVDNGYAFYGSTSSYGSGSNDVWVVKIDNEGNIQWEQTFGGENVDEAFSGQQTNDGDHIVAGYTNSFGNGEFDFYLIKTDELGNVEWTNTYGGSLSDEAWSVIESTEGGYLLTGFTNSYGAGSDDFWVIKTDKLGNLDWDQTYGTTSGEEPRTIIETESNNYVIYGQSSYNDYHLLAYKIDQLGNVIWEFEYFDNSLITSYIDGLIQTNDKGYALLGENLSTGDCELIKIKELIESDFIASPIDGCNPLEVNFTDNSIGSPESWKWDFQNDGIYDSFIQNPSYEYDEAGIYSVKFWAGDSVSSDSLIKIDYIRVFDCINIEGYSFINETRNNSNIKVKFTRQIPDFYTDCTYTDSFGYFNIDLPVGIYDISYFYENYHEHILYDQVLYSSQILDPITLIQIPGLLNVPDFLPTIQSAINYSVDGDTILIQPGVYIENLNLLSKSITLSSLFLITQDTTYITQTIIDGNQNGSVISLGGLSSTPIIKGLTITNGNSNSGGGLTGYSSNPILENLEIINNTANNGGGIWLNVSTAFLSDVIIRDNIAHNLGGGICTSSAGLELINVQIVDNYAEEGGGIRIYSEYTGQIFTNVIISGNTAIEEGGGIHCRNSNPIFNNVSIIGNHSNEDNGGGFYLNESNPEFNNVIILGNQSIYGGGLYCYTSNPSFQNVTITSNLANNDGGGLYLDVNSNLSLINSIVSFNQGDYGIYNESGTPSIFYSDLYANQSGNFHNCGDWVGVNIATNVNGDSCDAYFNIQLDPSFVDTTNGDFHLTETSPCIDAGDPLSDLDPDGTIADMGAYYFDQSNQPPIADFTADVLYGYHPLTVSFEDLSSMGSNTIIDWKWGFGDGDSAFVQNPEHIYSVPGYYDVTLNIEDTEGLIDSETKEDFVSVYSLDELPAAPTNLMVEIVDNDAVISWSKVDTTIYGNPIDVDYYIVFYSETSIPDSLFYYHGFTADTTYVHEAVNQFAELMFYKVISYIGNIDRIFEIYRNRTYPLKQ